MVVLALIAVAVIFPIGQVILLRDNALTLAFARMTGPTCIGHG